MLLSIVHSLFMFLLRALCDSCWCVWLVFKDHRVSSDLQSVEINVLLFLIMIGTILSIISKFRFNFSKFLRLNRRWIWEAYHSFHEESIWNATCCECFDKFRKQFNEFDLVYKNSIEICLFLSATLAAKMFISLSKILSKEQIFIFYTKLAPYHNYMQYSIIIVRASTHVL